MSSPDGDSFDNLTDEMNDQMDRAAQTAEWLARRSISYEDQMVRKVIAYFNIKLSGAELRRSCSEFGESDRATFHWFAHEFPSFPAMLGARFIPYVHEITIADLYKRISRTKLVEAYSDLRAAAPDEMAGGKIGLLFHWPDLGDMVLHDYESLSVSGFRMSWYRAHERVLHLDQLGSKSSESGFLFALSQLWAP